jgi:hypothetical protein
MHWRSAQELGIKMAVTHYDVAAVRDANGTLLGDFHAEFGPEEEFFEEFHKALEEDRWVGVGRPFLSWHCQSRMPSAFLGTADLRPIGTAEGRFGRVHRAKADLPVKESLKHFASSYVKAHTKPGDTQLRRKFDLELFDTYKNEYAGRLKV